jgi:hypothetical protein
MILEQYIASDEDQTAGGDLLAAVKEATKRRGITFQQTQGCTDVILGQPCGHSDDWHRHQEQGWYVPSARMVYVSPHLSLAQQAKVAAHEFTHVCTVPHHLLEPIRPWCEVVAEVGAASIVRRLGREPVGSLDVIACEIHNALILPPDKLAEDVLDETCDRVWEELTATGFLTPPVVHLESAVDHHATDRVAA